jgi:hypothetical protein
MSIYGAVEHMATRTVLPFVVEDGTGLVNSTSYASVEFFDTYMDMMPDAYKSVFMAADTFAKQQVLVWATRLLDACVFFPSVNTSYRNTRVSQRQALHFPRAGMADADGWVIDSRSVPLFIQHATCQWAFELLQQPTLIDEPPRGIHSASVGPLSVQFDANYAHLPRAVPRSVRLIIGEYGGVVRGDVSVRAIPLFRA